MIVGDFFCTRSRFWNICRSMQSTTGSLTTKTRRVLLHKNKVAKYFKINREVFYIYLPNRLNIILHWKNLWTPQNIIQPCIKFVFHFYSVKYLCFYSYTVKIFVFLFIFCEIWNGRDGAWQMPVARRREVFSTLTIWFSNISQIFISKLYSFQISPKYSSVNHNHFKYLPNIHQ